MKEGQPTSDIPSFISGDRMMTRSDLASFRQESASVDPGVDALRTCPQLVIVRGDWEWKQCSGFIAILSPILQQFSIDECFIDMSLRCQERSVTGATRLKDEIKSKLGFTMSASDQTNYSRRWPDFRNRTIAHALESEAGRQALGYGIFSGSAKTEERLTACSIRPSETWQLGMGSSPDMGQKFAVQLHENASGRMTLCRDGDAGSEEL